MIILSVIIPTYNMSKYLKKCLDSLIFFDDTKQIEVLIVNDGSKDDSSSIAHSYQEKYPGIFRVIDKENGNYGSCVNRGLMEAKGKYIKVLDADDYFNSEQFLNYLDILDKTSADLVISSYSIVTEDGGVREKRKFPLAAMKELNFSDICNIPEIMRIQMHAVTYKKTVFDGLGYKQTEGISYTDSEWVFTPMCGVKTAYYADVDLYQYLVGRAGQTVDEQNYIKNIAHSMKTSYARLAYLKDFRTRVSAPVLNYLNYKLIRSVDGIYKRFLIKDQCPVENLAEYDTNLKNLDEDFYKLSGNLKVLGFPFVGHYRATKQKAPWWVRKLFKFAKLLKA